MVLQEVFDQLATAELNNIYLVDQLTKEIDPAMYAKVAAVVNGALTALHTRFLLRTGRLTLVLDPTISTYQLNSRYMQGKLAKANTPQYLKLSPDFKDNLLKVHAVTDECGRKYGINNGTDYFSVHEAAYDTLMVSPDLYEKHKVRELTIEYRQDHKMIPTRCDGLDPECYGLTLPRTHLMALCLHVASRLHQPIGLQDGTYSSNSFAVMYNQECARLDGESLHLTQLGVNYGVSRKGFP